MDNKAMFKLSYGLFVLTANENGFDNGCIINTCGQVTTTPNRISIAVNKLNKTHDMIHTTGVFNVSIISEAAKFEVFTRFGFQSGKDLNKFADMDKNCFDRAENGVVYINEAGGMNAYISGKVVQEIDLGTHTMFIADVTDAVVLNAQIPSATYNYYQSNIKPRPQFQAKPAAPAGGDSAPAETTDSTASLASGSSAQATTNGSCTVGAAPKKYKWVCVVCGYVYEGDPIPADFICPICKHGASDFERVEA